MLVICALWRGSREWLVLLGAQGWLAWTSLLGTKPHSSHLDCVVLGSPSVTGIFWASPVLSMLALLWRLGKDKHKSVLDAVWKSPDSRHIAEQQGHWHGLQEQAVPAAPEGKGCM